MGPTLTSIALVEVATVAIVAAARWYFHQVRVDRPPIGVFNLRDIAFTFVVLVILPPLYLHLPIWLVASILVVMASGLAYITVRSALRRRVALAAVGLLAAAEVTLTTVGHGQSMAFVVVNDIAVGLLAVGVANIWAQSGIHGREVVVFACAVAVFDLVATWLLPVMVEFFTRVQALPFAPMLASGRGPDAVALGMGDLLFIVLWPLVAEKAFGRRAGLWAAAGTVCCLLSLDALFAARVFTSALPAMVFLGPAILTQYLWFRRQHGMERSFAEHEAASRPEALARPLTPTLPIDDLLTALSQADGCRPQEFVAMHDGRVIGTGPSPGAAIIAARKADSGTTPVLVLTTT